MAERIEDLFHREGQRIYSLLLRLTGNAEEAADLTQEVFLKATRAYAAFEERSSPGTWLYRIAINSARDRWRRRRHPTESYDAAIEAGRAVEPASAADCTEAPLLAEEAARLLNEGLAGLEPAAREILLPPGNRSAFLPGNRRILRIPLETDQSRLARARSALPGGDSPPASRTGNHERGRVPRPGSPGILPDSGFGVTRRPDVSLAHRKDDGIMPNRNPADMHIGEAEWSMLLDGDSLPSERIEHRASCSACSREWRVRRSLRDTLRHAAPVPLPPGLSTRISATLSRSAATGATGPRSCPAGYSGGADRSA